eukprot:951698-Pelagomonas_calceolata.AAC.3
MLLPCILTSIVCERLQLERKRGALGHEWPQEENHLYMHMDTITTSHLHNHFLHVPVLSTLLFTGLCSRCLPRLAVNHFDWRPSAPPTCNP